MSQMTVGPGGAQRSCPYCASIRVRPLDPRPAQEHPAAARMYRCDEHACRRVYITGSPLGAPPLGAAIEADGGPGQTQ